MSMAMYHTQIKDAHVGAVITSGLLFATRGMVAQFGACWARAFPLRCASYVIDTILLTAALMLVSILHQYPFVDGWLTAKVGLPIVYTALGILALGRGPTPRVRMACYITALCVYAFITSIAIEHDPRGVLLILRL